MKWEILVDGGLETGKKTVGSKQRWYDVLYKISTRKMISKLGSLEEEIPVDKGLKTGKTVGSKQRWSKFVYTKHTSWQHKY